jgi:SAM-dependent methyltransferase
MTTPPPLTTTPSGLAASPWILRFAPLVPSGPVLDLAAGSGRHSRLFRSLGHDVLAVDRDPVPLATLTADGIDTLAEDLESGTRPACLERRFAAIVVTNYLHRPLLPAIVWAVAPGGWLLYETFAQGNERFGKPSNPDFLLAPGELLDAVHGRLRVVAYEDIEIASPRPAMVQRIAARAA